jgi:hypothetical protein
MRRVVSAATVVVLLGITGCGPPGLGPNAGDFIVQIAGDYYIQRMSEYEIRIAPHLWNEFTPIIPINVIECNTDGRFVIAKRQGLKRRSPNNPNDTYEVPDPLVFDYWILDTGLPIVYGPLTLEQFAAKRKELGIAPSLRLEDIYSFRP